MLKQDAKLIATQPRQRIARTQLGAQESGDLSQQVVSSGVTAGIIDHLELVKVEVQQRMRIRRVQEVRKAAFEFKSILQTGEGVMSRLVGKLLGEFTFLRDIPKHQHDADAGAIAVPDGC